VPKSWGQPGQQNKTPSQCWHSGLPSKHEALSSNPSTTLTQKKMMNRQKYIPLFLRLSLGRMNLVLDNCYDG
jgi:hypothetical protein